MPTVSSIAGQHYGFKSYLAMPPQTVVFSRFVNMSTITYPVKTITFDGAGTGVFGDVKEDQTILVFDGNTTTLKGRLQVSAGASTSTVIQVEEFSKGTLDLADNDRVEVVEEYRIHTWLIEAAAAFRKRSRIDYVSQNSAHKPTANGGGWWYGWCDDGQTYATVTFDWTTSFPNDPTNTGGLTYLVAPKDGTITVGTATSSTCTITFPYGQRWIDLSVTDANNAATHTRRINIDVYHKTLRLPLSVQIQNRSYTHDSGWSITGVLPSSASAALSVLPEGSPIGVFEDERYNGTIVSYGSNAPTYRSHIKGVFFLVRDSIRISAEGDEVTFEAVGPLAILEQTAALPQLMVRDSTPNKWTELKGLTVKLALTYVQMWHASFPFDFIQYDGTEYDYSRLAIEDDSSLAAQLRDLAQSINVKLTCDRLGRLLLVRDPNYMNTGNRVGRDTQYAITLADFQEIEFTTEHRRTTKFVRGEGIINHTSTGEGRGLFSDAPGSPGEGTSVETLPRQVWFGQTDANERTGHHYAAVNGLYYDTTTKAITIVPQGASVSLMDSHSFIEPAYLEWFTVTLPASTNVRGRAFSPSTRWLVDSMDISYDMDAGTKDIRATISHETWGPPGVTYVMPQSSDNGLEPLPPLDITLPGLDLIPPVVPVAGGTVVVGGLTQGNEHFYIDRDGARFSTPADAGGPNWIEHTMSALGHAGNHLDFVSSPFSPLYLGTGNTVNTWETSSTKIHRCINHFGYGGVLPAYTPYHTWADTSANVIRRIEQERRTGYQDWVISVSYDFAYGMKCAYSLNASGATPTFTESVVSPYTDGTVVPNLPALYVSPHTDGLAYTIAFNSSGIGVCHRTLDKGATWAVGGPNLTTTRRLGFEITCPYHTYDTVFYYTDATGSGVGPFTYFLKKSVGGVITDVSPDVGGTKYAPGGGGIRELASDDSDTTGKKLVLIGRSQNTSSAFGVFKSSDGGTTWTTVITPDVAVLWRSVFMANSKVYFVGNGVLGYADFNHLNSEADIDVRTGDFVSSSLITNFVGGA